MAIGLVCRRIPSLYGLRQSVVGDEVNHIIQRSIVLRSGEHRGVCQTVLRIEGLLAERILYLISGFLLVHRWNGQRSRRTTIVLLHDIKTILKGIWR
jgi:metal-dependent hydrolase (beta-lactamase superfamily II)